MVNAVFPNTILTHFTTYFKPTAADLCVCVFIFKVDGLLPVGPTPSAAVSTVKRKGQRGDVSIDTLLEITLSPPDMPGC